MIKNIVLSSGSIYGISYLGCLKILEEKKLLDNFENIIGCSVGSMFSLCICLDYKYNDLIKIFKKVDINIFNDIQYDNIINFTNTYGFQKGDRIINILKILVKAKMDTPEITFKDLYEKTKKNLIICTTCLTTSSTEYFDYKNTPLMNVIDAIRMSIAIPFLFEPIKYKDKLYVDGALLNSYPIDYFNDTKETLGILIDYKNENKIQNIEDYCLSVIFCSLKNIKKSMYEKYQNNTILINCNNECDSIDFSISHEKKMCLVEDGFNCTKEYIESESFKAVFCKED